LTAVVAVGGIGLAGYRVRQRGRDQQYLGLTPGLAPGDGRTGAVGPRRGGPVTVQFTPPAGFHAGQLGTLIDERADPHDVTASLVDLAVRGYLRIEKVGDDISDDEAEVATEDDWRLVRLDTRRDGDLLAYERLLLDEI